MMRTEVLLTVFRKMWVMAVLLVMITAVADAAPSEGGRLFPVKSGKMAVFIDADGTVIIPPLFTDAKGFTEGLAAVQDADSGKWGYIDRTGNFVIQPQFKMAFPFSEGLAAVELESGGDGFIDDTGKLVILGSGGPIHDGLIRIRTKEKTVFADKNGATVLEVPYDAWQVGGGLIAFMKNRWMGFMDRTGKVVIQPVYHCDVNWRDQQFEERITPVSTLTSDGKEKYGLIDRNGKTVVDFQYEWAEQFFDGLAMVSRDGKYGYVNAAGEVAIPRQFDEACHFAEGLAAVKVGEHWGFIDTKGRMVIAPQFLSRMWGSPMVFSEGLAAVRTETGTGFINQAGEMVVPPVYRSAEDFSGGLAVGRALNSPPVYVNQRGEVVWPRD